MPINTISSTVTVQSSDLTWIVYHKLHQLDCYDNLHNTIMMPTTKTRIGTNIVVTASTEQALRWPLPSTYSVSRVSLEFNLPCSIVCMYIVNHVRQVVMITHTWLIISQLQHNVYVMCMYQDRYANTPCNHPQIHTPSNISYTLLSERCLTTPWTTLPLVNSNL